MNQAVAHRSRRVPLTKPPRKRRAEQEIFLKPIRRVRLYENAVDQIQTLILKKKYRAGDRLPSERSLAQQFHISRHSLREALRILDVLGFIDTKVGDGIYVKQVDPLPYLQSLKLSLRSKLQDEGNSLVKLWRARRILETGMVDLAAKQVNEPFLKSLWWSLEEMKKNIDRQEAFISAGIRFHRLIAGTAQNEILLMIWDLLANLIRKSQTQI